MPRFQQWSDTGGQKVTKGITRVAPHPVADSGLLKIAVGATKFVEGVAQMKKTTDLQNAKDYAIQAQADLTAQWAKKSVELKNTAKDGSAYLDGVSTFFAEQKQALLDGAPNKYAADQVNSIFNTMRGHALAQASDTAARLTANAAVESNESALNKSKVATYLDPESYTQQVQLITKQIQDSQIPESSKPQVIQEQIEDLRKSQIQGIIAQDPYKAVRMLGADVGLKSSDQQYLMRQAVNAKEKDERTMLAQDRLAHTQAAQLQKKLEDNTAKNGDDLVSQGKLTSEWLRQNKNNLSETDYRYFNSKVAGKPSAPESNLTAFTDLDYRARQGVNIHDDARKALMDGLITQSDYVQLMNRSDQHDQLPTPYKQGENYLRTTFVVNPLNPSAGAAQRRANALSEYDNWFRNNQNASVSEAMSKAQEINKRYQLVSLDDRTRTILYGPAPRYLVGSRQQPDMNATILKTQQAYEDGQITKEQYNEEQKIITQWTDIQKDISNNKANKANQ